MFVFTSESSSDLYTYVFQQQIENIFVTFEVTDLECSKYGIDELKYISIANILVIGISVILHTYQCIPST